MNEETLPELDLPGAPDSDGWRRLHPLSPILRGGLFLIVLTGIVIVNLRDTLVRLFVGADESVPGETDDITDLFAYLVNGGYLIFVLLGLLVVLLGIVFFSWAGWRFRTYRITVDTVEARSGVMFKQHRRAPLDRVQSVNLQRPLLARVLGLTKLEVLTGGTGGKVELTYLGHADSKHVREQILRLAATRKAGERPGAPTGAAAQASVDAAPSADAFVPPPGTPAPHTGGPAPAGLEQHVRDFIDPDVSPEALANNTFVRVPTGRLLGSIALSWESVIAVFLILLAGSWGLIGTILGALGQSAWTFMTGSAALLTLIPIIFSLVVAVFSQINKGFHFTLSKVGDSVQSGAGLTSTTTDSIPLGRIHAIGAHQPLFWRPFGWWRVRVTLAGHSVSDASQGISRNLVLPVGPIGDVQKVIETLIPGAAADLVDGLTGPGNRYLGAPARARWVLWFARKRAGIELNVPGDEPLAVTPPTATLRIRRGFLTRSLSIMPIVRAQSIELRRPMLHYWLGLATLQAHTVMGPVNLQVRGLDLTDARRTFDALAHTVLAVQGAEAESESPAAPISTSVQGAEAESESESQEDG